MNRKGIASICALIVIATGIITVGIGIAIAVPPAIIGGIFVFAVGSCAYIFTKMP